MLLPTNSSKLFSSKVKFRNWKYIVLEKKIDRMATANSYAILSKKGKLRRADFVSFKNTWLQWGKEQKPKTGPTENISVYNRTIES